MNSILKNPLIISMIIITFVLVGYFAVTINKPEQNQKASQGAPLQVLNNNFLNENDHVQGNEDAKVTLIEYTDLECPFCKKFHPVIKKIIVDYGDRVRWVYRHIPLDYHANAQKEAEASECVAYIGGNDKFFQYVDLIFQRTKSNGTGFSLNYLAPLAKEVGIDQASFNECFKNAVFAKRVKDDLKQAIEEGVKSTPTTFIYKNGVKKETISGFTSYEQLKNIIDNLLK